MNSQPLTLSRDEVRELDRRAIQEYALPGIVLMENAGRGVAELLQLLNPSRMPTFILCGPGNNGGDGFVIARHLDNHGWPTRTYLFADRVSVKGDALINLEVASRSHLITATQNSWTNEVAHVEQQLASMQRPAWVVDALFGTGLTRALQDPYVRIVTAINQSNHSILSVDLPSGLDCDTGVPLGPTIRAHHTATFVAPKQGFLNPKSRECTGEVHVIDIGVPRKLIDEYCGT